MPQNEFIVDALIDSVTFGREKLTEIIDRCTSLTSENACEASFKVRRWIIDQKPQLVTFALITVS